MKGGQNLHALQADRKAKQETAWIHPCKCMVCGKDNIEGYYARFGESGVCSSDCMRVQAKLPRYPGHSAEDFERKHNL